MRVSVFPFRISPPMDVMCWSSPLVYPGMSGTYIPHPLWSCQDVVTRTCDDGVQNRGRPSARASEQSSILCASDHALLSREVCSRREHPLFLRKSTTKIC